MPPAALAAVAIAGTAASVGTSMYSSNKATKASNNAARDASAANAKAIADAKAAKDTAASQAAGALTQRKRSIARSQSVFTSPLGVTDQASTIRKTLLGQ